MSTGTVSLDAVHTDHPAATAGGITVAGPVDSGTPVDEALPIQTESASHLDLVVATGLPTNELWLIPPINKAIKAVSPAVAREYLRRVQQVETVVSDDARTHLEVYASDLSRATDTATPKSIPTPVTVVATVERLAHATARLELTETVTTTHLESAVRLHDAALRYRSYTAESPAYWRDCAGDPAYYT